METTRKEYIEIAKETIGNCMRICADDRNGEYYYANNFQRQEPKLWISDKDGCYDIVTLSYDAKHNDISISALEWGNKKLVLANIEDLNFATISSLVTNMLCRVYRKEYNK